MRKRSQILIVDDSELNRSMLADILYKEYDALEAENGREAIAMLQEHEHEISTVSYTHLFTVSGEKRAEILPEGAIPTRNRSSGGQIADFERETAKIGKISRKIPEFITVFCPPRCQEPVLYGSALAAPRVNRPRSPRFACGGARNPPQGPCRNSARATMCLSPCQS